MAGDRLNLTCYIAVVAVVILLERRTPATRAFAIAGVAIGAETSSF